MLTLENINLIQRTISLVALGLLAVQLYSNTSKKLFTFFMYLFVLIQPFLIILARYIFNSDLDPFFMFTDLCVLCGNKAEFTVNFLRITFYAVSLAVFVPLIKNYDNFLKKYWKYSEVFFYIGFYALSIYVFNSSPIIKSNLFLFYFWGSQGAVIWGIYKKIKQVVRL
jgi:hypothetical protein